LLFRFVFAHKKVFLSLDKVKIEPLLSLGLF